MLELQASDPMVKDLRTGDQTVEAWTPLLTHLGGRSEACGMQGLRGDAEESSLAQETATSTVYASYVQRATWPGPESEYECPEGHATFTFEDGEGMLGKDGVYDSWSVTVDVPTRLLLTIRGGTVLSQDAHHAELRLGKKGERLTVVLGPPGTGSREQGDTEHLGVLLQKETPQREAFWLAAAAAAVTLCWILPFVGEWAPPATRRRWTVAAATACSLTGASLLYALAGSAEVPWPGWLYPGRGALLAVWWWVLLPFLLFACLPRLIKGRPPEPRELLPMLLPSAVLPVLACVFAVCEGRWWPLLSVAAAALVTAAVAYGLRGGALGSAGRRWAVTAAGAAWLTVLAAGPGTGLPPREDPQPVWDVSNSLAMLELNWGWYGLVWSIVVVVNRRAWLGWPLLYGSFVALAIAEDWAPLWYLWGDGGSWDIIGRYPAGAASYPVAQLVLALLVTLLVLRTHDAWYEGWPLHVRTIAVGLGIAAAGTGLAAYGLTMFGDDAQRGGYYIALLIAATGFTWLLPPDAENRAVRLHQIRPAAHNRLMHALLKDQTLAAGRREFLTASRTALAQGELTARQWSARWRRLGALGDRATAPQHSVNLRLAALGTSGGRTALRNGTAAAVLLTVLSLPWLGYTLPPPLSADFPEDAQVWAYALRWAVYGFVYGYVYSWLRGGSPIGKSLCLLAVVLPAELAQLLYQGLEPRHFAVQLLLTTGNCLAIFLILGLYWEARLVRVAGLRWGQIRNFRSLAAAAVPATTVLVAAATALATAMVGAWIAPDGNPTPTNPGTDASVSADPNPGP
ncbi:MAG: hypothetical protein HOV73_12040 [Streptomyces sp.]|nr:hypothetical protein [Streptomyces sp.]